MAKQTRPVKVWFQQGTVWDLLPQAYEGFRKMVKHAVKDVYITCGCEGDHLPHSLHYAKKAWDMRKSGFTRKRLREILGRDWDVVAYPWGFHVELDPK
jgi:hypothetical protein